MDRLPRALERLLWELERSRWELERFALGSGAFVFGVGHFALCCAPFACSAEGSVLVAQSANARIRILPLDSPRSEREPIGTDTGRAYQSCHGSSLAERPGSPHPTDMSSPMMRADCGPRCIRRTPWSSRASATRDNRVVRSRSTTPCARMKPEMKLSGRG